MNDQTREAGGFRPVIVRSSLLETIEWLEHGFGTRLATGWPPGAGYANLRQIHSDIVVCVERGARGTLGVGDALVTGESGVWLGVRTADCAPVILADAVHRALALVHAGWRGAVNSILARTIERMHAEFGTRPGDLLAAIGPAIGPCCFEVGEEVARHFTRWWPERAGLGTAKTTIDLAETMRRQLCATGVPQDRVDKVGECTQCHAERYHSFRRERHESGRMISAARLRP